MAKITYLDPVHCQADIQAVRKIKNILEYDSVYWKPGPKKKIRIQNKAYFVDGRNGIFLSGFLSRIKKTFPEIQIDVKNKEFLKFNYKPSLKGVDLRDYQIKGVYAALQKQRGIIKKATGSGKTYIAATIINTYRDKNIIYLCHSNPILEQTKEEFEALNIKFNSIDSKSKIIKPGLNFVNIKTFSSIPAKEYDEYIDVCLIDEAHHCISRTSQYGNVLQNMLCPVKIGFTATLPDKGEKRLAMEGLLGPVISELTIQEGIEKGIFVKPKISLIPVPLESSLTSLNNYKEIIENAIVHSKIRNNIIILQAVKRIVKGKTVLIMIQEIEHGENLMELVYSKYYKYKDDFRFVQFHTKTNLKEEIKKSLNDKKIKCVIATSTWGEGVNIKSLNCVMFGFIGKSYVRIIQTIGRGTRTSEGKTELELVDFIDRYKYLSQHFAKRKTIYLKENWV